LFILTVLSGLYAHAIMISVQPTLMEMEEGEKTITDRCQNYFHYFGKMKEGQKLQAC